MARIKGRTREETHTRALDAASRVFAEFGYDGTSLSRIASVAGVTPATLCHHFGSKRALYDTVVDNIYKDFLSLANGVDPTMPLPKLLEAIYEHLDGRRDSVRLLMRNIIDSGGITRRIREVHMGPQLAFVSHAVATRFKVPIANARRAVIVLTHLVMRFITNSDDDNRTAFGVDTAEALHDEIMTTLHETAIALLGPVD